ncbi:MAG TPA: hypothetical protein VGG86_12690 [Roseiarcus sp.]|jgi:hypothetical protein
MLQISNRWRFLRELSKQRFVRLALSIWVASGIWDLALAEWIPEEYSKRLPRVYQVIAAMIGLLSWQLWVVVGAVILAFALLEYNFQRTSKSSGSQPQSPSPQVTQPSPSGKPASSPAILKPQEAQPPRVEEPLPANATFRMDGRIFWAAPRRYSPDEAKDMRALLREIYNQINGPLKSIVASYDGTATNFTHEWKTIIAERGTNFARQALLDIRQSFIQCHISLFKIIESKPYYRADLMEITGYGELIGEINEILNNYTHALDKLPDKSAKDLVELVITSHEKAFEEALAKYSAWIGAFNNKMELLRPEIEYLSDQT